MFIPATESVTESQEYIEKRAEHLNIPVKVQSKLGIIIDELYSNVARYSGATIVKIKCEPEDDMIRLTLKDNGIEYDPFSNEDPDVSLPAEERAIGGLGIFMVKNMAEKVEYERTDGKNIVNIYMKTE